MSFKITSLIILGLSFCNPAPAQTNIQDWKFSGFGFWVYGKNTASNGQLKLGHLWLIGDKQIAEGLSVKIILAPKGPPQMVHSFFFKWANPTNFISYLRVGRMETPFGNGATKYRIDRNPTVLYSITEGPVVARSNGLDLGGDWHNLNFMAGVFSGERVGGNIPTIYDQKWDYCARLQYDIANKVTIGTSQRLGAVSAWGIHTALVDSATFVRAEAEMINSLGVEFYSLLLMYDPTPWLEILGRTEILESSTRWTAGFRIFLPYDCEIKANTILDPKIPPMHLAQLVLRW